MLSKEFYDFYIIEVHSQGDIKFICRCLSKGINSNYTMYDRYFINKDKITKYIKIYYTEDIQYKIENILSYCYSIRKIR